MAGLGSGPASPDPQVKLRRPSIMLPLTPASHTLDHAHAQDSKVDLDAKQSDSSSYDTAGTNDIGVVSGAHSRGPVSTVGASLGRGGANLSTPGGGVRTLKGWLMCATTNDAQSHPDFQRRYVRLDQDGLYVFDDADACSGYFAGGKDEGSGSHHLQMRIEPSDVIRVHEVRADSGGQERSAIEIELVSNDGDTGASVWLEHTDSDSDGSSHARWLSHLRSYLQNQPAQKQQDMTGCIGSRKCYWSTAGQGKCAVQWQAWEHVKQHAMFAACAFEEPGESQETVSAASSQQSFCFGCV